MEHRSAARVRAVLKAEIRFNDGLMRVPCLVRDISGTGARLDVSADIAVPERFDLYIEKKHQTRRAVVRRRRGREIGVAFEDVAEPAAPADPGLAERVAKLEAQMAEVRSSLAQIAAALKSRT